jgi:hypothetical protein
MSADRANLPDFRGLGEQACVTLWGKPDKRDRKELRWNGHDAYSAKTFSLKKRMWYDHGEQRGGGLLDLVAYSKGQPKQKLRGKAYFDAWVEAYKIGLLSDPPPQKGPCGGGPIIATYPYHDESGALLFEVVRFDAADPNDRFRQRRPDGKGGWIWDIKGVRTHILYRLPALIAAVKVGQRVLITEGERDANTAAVLGLAATTMPGGVNKWFAMYDEFFRDADIVIVSDNDPQAKDPKTGAPQFHSDGRPVHVGQDHATKLAKRLCKVAAHVRTIIFEQKDLSAWKEAGGDRAALEARIATATDLVKQPPPPDDDEGAEAVLAELNRDNAVVLCGSQTRVLRFEDTPHEAGGERYVHRLQTFLRFGDFSNFYLNRYINKADGAVSIGRWWLAHPDRKQYPGVAFIPGAEPIVDGRLNLWRGFGGEHLIDVFAH